METIDFTLNGRAVSVAADPTAILLDVLRGPLGLTGTRYGCGQEQCGACLVLLDGAPAYACGREIGSIAGQVVITVEGLGTPDAPHPIQTAMLAEQAGQCGYCLSGIIVAAAALLDSHPRPDRAAIVEALDPHLCRCGAQNRMVRAVERAAAALAGAAA